MSMEQLELFAETKPEPKPRTKKRETQFLNREELEIIETLREIIAMIKGEECEEYDWEDVKSSILFHLRTVLGVPEHISREVVLPFLNVPRADSEYMLECILESFNPELHRKYLAEKEAFFNQLLGGEEQQ